MEIPEKLMKLKYYILFSTLISLSFLSLVLLAPRFLDIVSYFWPLFVSTALFLFTVVFFAKVSPLTTSSETDDQSSLLSCAEKAGEGLLDYVAGQPPQVLLDTIDDEEDDEHDEHDDDEELDDEDEEFDETPFVDEKSNHDKKLEESIDQTPCVDEASTNEKSNHNKLESSSVAQETEVK